MTDKKKRWILYPVTLLVLSGLCYAGFIYPRSVEPEALTLLNSAQALARVGSFDEAVQNANRALEQEPDNRYAHIILGYAYGQLGKHAESVSHYGRALELTARDDKERGLLRLYHAEALTKAGRAEEAVKEAREVVAENPAQLQAHYVIAGALRALNRPDQALVEYRIVEKAAPKDPDPLVLRAEVEQGRGNLDLARDLLARAVELAPNRAELRMRKAGVHEALGEREQAVSEVLATAEHHMMFALHWIRAHPGLEAVGRDARVREALAVGLEKEPAKRVGN